MSEDIEKKKKKEKEEIEVVTPVSIEIKSPIEMLIDSIGTNNIKRDKYFITNSKIANEITNDLLGFGDKELVVANKKKEKATVTVSLLTEDLEIKNITTFDKLVMDATCSLFELGVRNKNGSFVFTPEAVVRAMNGCYDGTMSVSPALAKKVTASLRKLMMTRITIDWKEQAGLYYKNGEVDIELESTSGPLLPIAEELVVRSRGTRMHGFRMDSIPVLYKYSYMLQQVLRIPVKYLEMEDLSANETTLVMREYLLRQIEMMKKGYRNNHCIKFETLYKQINFNAEEMEPKKASVYATRYRQYATKILDTWKNQNYIYDYEVYKFSGCRTVVGIRVYISEADKASRDPESFEA